MLLFLCDKHLNTISVIHSSLFTMRPLLLLFLACTVSKTFPFSLKNSFCKWTNMSLLDKKEEDIDPEPTKKMPYRLGRTKDEDGKSNIWAVEPKMEIVEDDYGLTTANKNLLVSGLLLSSILISLPLLYILTSFFVEK